MKLSNSRECWKCHQNKSDGLFRTKWSRYCDDCYFSRSSINDKLSRYMERAKDKGLEFNLTEEDLLQPLLCVVCNGSLVEPHLDRIDNSLGYIKSNVYWICGRHNMLKRDGTLEEFELIVAYMRRYTISSG
jgi:hypothetical protein